MAEKQIPVAEDLTETETDILLYLYNNPEENHSSQSLSLVLEDQSRSPEEAVDELKVAISVLGTEPNSAQDPIKKLRKQIDVQADIEQLIVKSLVIGKREGKDAGVMHSNIQLTKKGEITAIEDKEKIRESVHELHVNIHKEPKSPSKPES